MLLIWIYIFFLTFIFLFFIVKKLNAFEFKNLSLNIYKITKFTFIFLLILTFIWLFLVIRINYQENKVEIDTNKITENVYY